MAQDSTGRSAASRSRRFAANPGAGTRKAALETALVRRLVAGDEEAFVEVVRRLQPGMFHLALALVRSRAVAEEVVQETWLAVVDGLPSFEERSSLKTWVFAILVNRAKTRSRREGRSVPFSALSSEETGRDFDPDAFGLDGRWAEPPGRWETETPERLLLGDETRRILEEALSALPLAQRAVVTMRDVERFTAAEVCNVLSISETNQRVLLHRGRARIRRALDDHLST